jgi:hypothetical protein
LLPYVSKTTEATRADQAGTNHCEATKMDKEWLQMKLLRKHQQKLIMLWSGAGRSQEEDSV